MRARVGLAQSLAAEGRQAEAMDHFWDMLRLNPGDNQGVRYALLCWLLELGDIHGTGQLFDRYPDDGSAHLLYGLLLHSLQSPGNHRQAANLLQKVVEWSPYVTAYLLDSKRPQIASPPYVGMGDENEAVDYAMAMAAWIATPGAISWRAGQIS